MEHPVHVYTYVMVTEGFLIAGDLTRSIIQGPLGLILGFLCGTLWGLLIRYVPERQDVSGPFALEI
jgi:hypothetical protein